MKGDKGTEVKTIQEGLIYLGYDLGKYGADGDFGDATDSAVRKFQKDNGLVVDGKYGTSSKAKLEALVAEKNKPVSTPTSTSNFKVRVIDSALNIREGAGTSYKIVGCIRDKGTYTIVQTSGSWGKLKSGAGWINISTKYVEYV
jgi:peptidoglycan hydrolase-like protein with peptidoglycan-binding domain